MRVIAGKFRSRSLQSLPGMDLRPTADRLRETVFNVLSAGMPNSLNDTVWIDLCAGTGAVGIEALSRGAAKVYFVEAFAPAAALINRNQNKLGLENGKDYEILNEDALLALHNLQAKGVTADFIFLDPPYRMADIYEQSLKLLSTSSLLGSKTIVIAEHHKKLDPGDGFRCLNRYRTLQQGDAALSFYRLLR